MKHIGAGDPDARLTDAGRLYVDAEITRLDQLIPIYRRHAADIVYLFEDARRRLVEWAVDND